MRPEETPFCTLKGLSEFSKSMSDLSKKLLTVHNLTIKDKAKEDKLDFWGKSEPNHFVYYGRHFLINDKYDFWIGLDIKPENITVVIDFDKDNNKTITGQIQEITDKLKKPKNKDGTYFHILNEKIVYLDDKHFEQFCNNLNSHILVNFIAEIFKELGFILK